MTMLRLNCTACDREVDLVPDEILLALREEPAEDGWADWAYVCPACASVVVRVANEHTTEVLMSIGVTAMTFPTEDELEREPHPEQPPSGPAFTTDDLIDFHLLLESDCWRTELEQYVAETVSAHDYPGCG